MMSRSDTCSDLPTPFVNVCANPETYRVLQDDMDIDAGRMLEGRSSL